jgi:hypothetical protein
MCGGDYTLILTRSQRKEMTGDGHQRHRVAGAWSTRGSSESVAKSQEKTAESVRK